MTTSSTNGQQQQLTGQRKGTYKAPEWAKHLIWYQIFPERFRNGDSGNDPTRERVGGPEGWEVSPWTGDWYEQSPWERSMGDSFRKGVFHRRYGGDLQGIIDKLDYLKELGVGGIYLNPVFDAISLHKYDASYYHHVDRFFGPDPEGDAAIIEREDPNDPSTWQWTSADRLYLKLIGEVHRRDMRIIMDGVFNHTGTDFWAFRDVKEKQRRSGYHEWYDVISFDEEGTGKNEFDYNGWWGFKGLPELKEVEGNLVEPVREHIFAVTRRWMDPNGDGDPSDGIDGWRLDVPEEVGKPFWMEWNALVREINPEAYTVGEIWTNKAREFVGGEMFTAVMNYQFTQNVQKFMIDRSIPATDFLSRLRHVRQDFPQQANYVMQNLMDSHDTPRIASMIVNPGRGFDERGKPEDGFDVRKPNGEERRVQKLIALFQYTYVGAPMIYYGTETGMWGADDPDDRKPMVWEEFEYEPEASHPLNGMRPVDDNNFDPELFDWYRKLGEIRNGHRVFRTGEYEQIMVDSGRCSFAFARFLSPAKFAVVAFNRSEQEQELHIPLGHLVPRENRLTDLISSKPVPVENRAVKITLPPVSGAVLMPEKPEKK